MAGYPKIWTILFSEGWFKSLSCLERGLFLQLLLLCKNGSDNGYVAVSDFTELATSCRLHRATCAKIVTKFDTIGVTQTTRDKHGSLILFVPKYVEYQELTAKEVVKKEREKGRKSGRLGRQPEQSKAEHTKPQQTPVAVDEAIAKEQGLIRSMDATKKSGYKKVWRDEKGRKPIDRFNEWVEKHRSDIFEMIRAARSVPKGEQVPDYLFEWAQHEISKMRTWLIGNPDKANKKLWGRFASGWLSRAAGSLTEGEEGAQMKIEEMARSPRGGPRAVGDIVKELKPPARQGGE